MYGIKTPYYWEGVEVMGATGRVDAYMWADVLITHLDFTQYTIIMSIIANRPIVHLVHNDIEYQSIKNGFGNQSVIYNSEWCRKAINYPIPSMVLHPPCDVKYYEVDRTGAEHITLISLNENKGADMFYAIAEAMPHKKFIGVVGSYDEQYVRQLPNVEIVQNSPDINATYKRTRILLMPSAYESWGRTATEAMCSGIPVICTPTQGLKENCKDAAVYVGKLKDNLEPGKAQVDRGTVQDWVDAINKVDKEYQKYSLLSKSRAAELDPGKELEELETFLINAPYGKK